MPIETVQPALLGQNGRINARTQVASAAVKNANLRELAPKVSPLSRAHIRGGVGNAVLTFVPSLVLDTVDSIQRDTQGKLKFDARRLAISSARSQSGNLAGVIGSVAGTAIALYFGLAAAPVIMVGLSMGFAAQVLWGFGGGSDYAGVTAENLLR